MKFYFQIYEKTKNEQYLGAFEVVFDNANKLCLQDKVFLFSHIIYQIQNTEVLESTLNQIQKILETREEFLLDFKTLSDFFTQEQQFQENLINFKQKVFNVLQFSNTHSLLLLKTKFITPKHLKDEQLKYYIYDDKIFVNFQNEKIFFYQNQLQPQQFPYFDEFQNLCQKNKQDYDNITDKDILFQKDTKIGIYQLLHSPNLIFQQFYQQKNLSLNTIFESQQLPEEFKLIFLFRFFKEVKGNFYKYANMFLKNFKQAYFIFSCILVYFDKLHTIEFLTFFLNNIKSYRPTTQEHFDDMFEVQNFILTSQIKNCFDLQQDNMLTDEQIQSNIKCYVFKQFQVFLNQNDQHNLMERNFQKNQKIFNNEDDFWIFKLLIISNEYKYTFDKYFEFKKDETYNEITEQARAQGRELDLDTKKLQNFFDQDKQQKQLFYQLQSKLKYKFSDKKKYMDGKNKKIKKMIYRKRDCQNILPNLFKQQKPSKIKIDDQLGFFVNQNQAIIIKIMNFPFKKNSNDFEQFLHQFGMDDYTDIRLPNSKKKSWQFQTQSFDKARLFMDNLLKKKYDGRRIQCKVIKRT